MIFLFFFLLKMQELKKSTVEKENKDWSRRTYRITYCRTKSKRKRPKLFISTGMQKMWLCPTTFLHECLHSSIMWEVSKSLPGKWCSIKSPMLPILTISTTTWLRLKINRKRYSHRRNFSYKFLYHSFLKIWWTVSYTVQNGD